MEGDENGFLPTRVISYIGIMLCVIMLYFESILPGFNYSKPKLISMAVEELMRFNQPSSTLPNSSSIYYLDKKEHNLIKWYSSNYNQKKIEDNNLGYAFDDYFKKQSDLANDTYLNICQSYLLESPLFTDFSKYTGIFDFKGAMDLLKNSIPVACRIITGDLFNIPESYELSQYFSIILIQGLKANVVDTLVFKKEDFEPKFTTKASNGFLKVFMKANQLISVSFYDRLLKCKSNILYEPKSCFDVSDFTVMDKASMKTKYGINFDSLNTHFDKRKSYYDVITNTAPDKVEVSDIYAEIALKHIFFRGNLIMAFEQDPSLLRKIFKGASLSLEEAKNRCNYVNFFTPRCRMKGISSANFPCSSDDRSSQDPRTMICGVLNIEKGSRQKKLIKDTVLSMIGREMEGNPELEGQVFFWSFYDPLIR